MSLFQNGGLLNCISSSTQTHSFRFLQADMPVPVDRLQ